jgi:hypothetical protein
MAGAEWRFVELGVGAVMSLCDGEEGSELDFAGGLLAG